MDRGSGGGRGGGGAALATTRGGCTPQTRAITATAASTNATVAKNAARRQRRCRCHQSAWRAKAPVRDNRCERSGACNGCSMLLASRVPERGRRPRAACTLATSCSKSSPLMWSQVAAAKAVQSLAPRWLLSDECALRLLPPFAARSSSASRQRCSCVRGVRRAVPGAPLSTASRDQRCCDAAPRGACSMQSARDQRRCRRGVRGGGRRSG